MLNERAPGAAPLDLTPAAEVEACKVCAGEGVILVGSGHNDREFPCECTESSDETPVRHFANMAVLP